MRSKNHETLAPGTTWQYLAAKKSSVPRNAKQESALSDTLLRQIEMLRMIPRQGKISPQQLYERLVALGYDTTERTVQRDLQSLSAKVPILCDADSKPHGWYWSKSAPVWNLPGLSLPEALAFQLLEKFSADLLPASTAEQLKPYFITAREQIHRELGPASARNWLRKVRCVTPNQPLLPKKATGEVLKALHSALMQECCLQIRYRQEDARERLVHPLGLVQYGQVFYAVVNFDGFTDVRLIAVHRIRQAVLVDKACTPPADFDLDRYIDEGAFGFGELGKSIKLRIRLYEHAGEHLQETRLSEDQEFHDLGDGVAEIKATVQLTRRLRWWLLAFGPQVEVLSPPGLRREVQAALQAAMNRYDTVPA
ncbi:MAG: transcriptional factor [Paucimonas sp.]|nr:transcriptional factor [Paucimonas sp.]